jgi:hypothetical protein
VRDVHPRILLLLLLLLCRPLAPAADRPTIDLQWVCDHCSILGLCRDHPLMEFVGVVVHSYYCFLSFSVSLCSSAINKPVPVDKNGKVK